MQVATMTTAIITMEMGMGLTRIIVRTAASWGLGRMGCGSVGRISSKRDGIGSSHGIISYKSLFFSLSCLNLLSGIFPRDVFFRILATYVTSFIRLVHDGCGFAKFFLGFPAFY